MTRLLLTRPKADSEAFAKRLAEYDIDSLIAPMIEILRCAHELPTQNNGFILTSHHALYALEKQYNGQPLYVVGNSTAEAAEEKGYKVETTSKTAEKLSSLLPETILTYLSGKDITQEFLNAERVIVYDAIAADALSQATINALLGNQLHGAVFFSTRTAKTFHTLVKEANLEHTLSQKTAYCLSEKIAEQCVGWEEVKISDKPEANSLLSTILN